MRDLLEQPLFTLNGEPVSAGLAGGIAAVFVILLLLRRWRRVPSDAAGQVRLMMRAQAELSQRLDARLAQTGDATVGELGRLGERLATIDAAQAGIRELGTRVADLQHVLCDKGRRGAFGQARMEAILSDALPPSLVSFQATLSNGKRPDALVRMPGRMAPLVVDAKFPLEAWRALEAAETAPARDAARRRMRADLLRHIHDVADKYLLPGETQDVALVFVPSETVLTDLQEDVPDALEAARRARVMPVSPALLVLAVQTVEAMVRDARIAQHARTIQAEVRALAADVATLMEAARRLRTHHDRTARDLDALLATGEAVERRAVRVENLDVGDAPTSRLEVPVRRTRADATGRIVVGA